MVKVRSLSFWKKRQFTLRTMRQYIKAKYWIEQINAELLKAKTQQVLLPIPWALSSDYNRDAICHCPKDNKRQRVTRQRQLSNRAIVWLQNLNQDSSKRWTHKLRVTRSQSSNDESLAAGETSKLNNSTRCELEGCASWLPSCKTTYNR